MRLKKASVVTLALLLAAAMALAGCAAQTPAAAPTAAPTAAAPTAAPTEAKTPEPAPTRVAIKTAGSTSVGPVLEALAEKYMEKYPNVEITVEAGGSGVGVTSCGDKTVDFGMASRNLKDEEKTKYPEMKSTVLCVDGVAVVVNSANPVTNLTIDQIRGIFTGTIKNWKEVGGPDQEIHKFTRDAASGTREAFQNLMLGKNAEGKQIEIDEKIFSGVYDSNGGVASAVQGDPAGVGYMSLGIVPSYQGIKSVGVDNVEATIANMENGTYKYTRPFNLLTMGDPSGAVAEFFNYCMKDPEAVKYMQEKGYLVP